MSNKNKNMKSESSEDQSQWVFLMPDSCVEKDKSNPVLVKLRHPKSDCGAMFLFSDSDSTVHEVIQYKEEYRSWFIGNTVQRDGSMFMVTPVDPVFLSLPYLMKAAKNGKQHTKYVVATAQCERMVELEARRYKQTLPPPSLSIRRWKQLALKGLKYILANDSKFMQLEQIIHDEEFEESRRLCSCHGNQYLDAVADTKGDDDYKVYRYNADSTLKWLQAKVERLSTVLEDQSINVSGGAQIDTYVQSKKNITNKDDYMRYAYGLVSDYLPMELSKNLKQHLDIKDPVIEHEKPDIQQPNSKKPKSGPISASEDYSAQNSAKDKKEEKLSRAQKQLSTVDKSGMKNIMSFFGKKAAAKK